MSDEKPKKRVPIKLDIAKAMLTAQEAQAERERIWRAQGEAERESILDAIKRAFRKP